MNELDVDASVRATMTLGPGAVGRSYKHSRQIVVATASFTPWARQGSGLSLRSFLVCLSFQRLAGLRHRSRTVWLKARMPPRLVIGPSVELVPEPTPLFRTSSRVRITSAFGLAP